MNRFVEWFFHHEGSTRAAAILRILVPCLVWTRWAPEFTAMRHFEPDWYATGALFWVSSIATFVGFQSRLSAAVLGFVVLVVIRYYFGYHGGMEGFTHHHTHLLGLVTCLLPLMPCGRSYSVDRWLALRRGRALPERGNLLGQRLVVVLLSSIYLWGTWSKLTEGYLDGDRMEQIFLHQYFGSDWPGGWFHPALVALSWCTIALEVFIGVGLWIPRVRGVAVLVGVVFHASLYYLLPVSTFSMTMFLLYLAVFDPDDVHRFIDRISAPV